MDTNTVDTPQYMFMTKLKGFKSQQETEFIILSVTIAEHELQKQRFLYHPGFNCEWHERMTETSCCSSANVKMLSFTLLASVCQAYGVDMKEGLHRPQSIQN